MLKANYLTLIIIGLLALGLAACSSAAARQSALVQEAPVVAAAKPVEAEVEEPQVEGAAAEKSMTKAEEPVTAEETMAEESMAKTDEATQAMAEEAMAEIDEKAMTEESTAQTGAAPVAEEAMAKVEETTAVVEEAEAITEAAPVEKEEMMPETGPTEAQIQLLASLENQGAPAELFNEVWLNSDPLKLADLHGKVVIVEFWTFGCYNCKNVVPSLRQWHQDYKDEGLVIIGVHTPEFGYEGEVANVKQALIDQDIPYAVAIDNDWQTWRAYNNRYWPAKYFIDKAGNLRHVHIGEGGYEQQEEIIQALLAEKV